MKIEGSVALVTGANRGLGQVFPRELVARGAAKVTGPRVIRTRSPSPA
jgi:NAD(P)-dependent dehydrogenase (short-subunit alcohol dehydrogenase family)